MSAGKDVLQVSNVDLEVKGCGLELVVAYRETLERSGDVEIDAVKAFLAAFEKVLRFALFPRKEAVLDVACPEHSIRAEADNRQSERGARARLGHDEGIVGRAEDVVIT